MMNVAVCVAYECMCVYGAVMRIAFHYVHVLYIYFAFSWVSRMHCVFHQLMSIARCSVCGAHVSVLLCEQHSTGRAEQSRAQHHYQRVKLTATRFFYPTFACILSYKQSKYFSFAWRCVFFSVARIAPACETAQWTFWMYWNVKFQCSMVNSWLSVALYTVHCTLMCVVQYTIHPICTQTHSHACCHFIAILFYSIRRD